MLTISIYIIKLGQVFLWLFCKAYCKLFFAVHYSQVPVEPTDRPRIVISNHLSLLDPILYVNSLSWKEMTYINPIRPILAKWYYYSPLFPLAYFIGCYPARPLFGALRKYSGTEAAIRYAKHGCTLGIYPEGQRVKHGSVAAKFGVVKILSNLDSPHIYLCKITKNTEQKRSYNVTITRADEIVNEKDPQMIMNTLYQLDKGSPA